jgi:hypothetical protein
MVSWACPFFRQRLQKGRAIRGYRPADHCEAPVVTSCATTIPHAAAAPFGPHFLDQTFIPLTLSLLN